MMMMIVMKMIIISKHLGHALSFNLYLIDIRQVFILTILLTMIMKLLIE